MLRNILIAAVSAAGLAILAGGPAGAAMPGLLGSRIETPISQVDQVHWRKHWYGNRNFVQPYYYQPYYYQPYYYQPYYYQPYYDPPYYTYNDYPRYYPGYSIYRHHGVHFGLSLGF